MLNRLARIVLTAAGLLLIAAPTARAADEPITLAVLGFEATGAAAAPDGGSALGQQMNDVLEAMLSGEANLALVDRSGLMRTLDEQAVNLSAVTDPASAVAIGRVVGARLLVTGKAFELGESRMVTAKVIGTETTLTRSLVVRGKLDDPLDTLVLDAADQLVTLLREHAAGLVASPTAADPLPGLIEQLKERDLPVIAIVIPEEHLPGTAARVAVPDPAVETELKLLLIRAGVDVRDLEDNALADWVKQFDTGGNPSWPRTLEGVDLVVVGEAFSEGGGRLGQLRLASARAEINVISRQNGRIVLADRVTTRGVDLAEQIAGKTALQKAGRVMGVSVLRYLVEHTDAKSDDQTDAAKAAPAAAAE